MRTQVCRVILVNDVNEVKDLLCALPTRDRPGAPFLIHSRKVRIAPLILTAAQFFQRVVHDYPDIG